LIAESDDVAGRPHVVEPVLSVAGGSIDDESLSNSASNLNTVSTYSLSADRQ